MVESESSLIHYNLFQDFSSMQKIVEERLSDLELSDFKKKMTQLWADFSFETEHQLIPRKEFQEKYESFLKSKVFSLSWFEGLHFSQQHIVIEETDRKSRRN